MTNDIAMKKGMEFECKKTVSFKFSFNRTFLCLDLAMIEKEKDLDPAIETPVVIGKGLPPVIEIVVATISIVLKDQDGTIILQILKYYLCRKINLIKILTALVLASKKASNDPEAEIGLPLLT